MTQLEMPRPDLLAAPTDRLSPIERRQIAFIRRTFEPGAFDTSVRWLQRYVGSTWIHLCTRHLRQIHGLARVPVMPREQSYILASNHRSFFDLYVVTAELVRRGLSHRILFPVRANFFYDSRLGFLVNGVMSFFAMYPPIFRDRPKLSLNAVSLRELAWMLRRGGMLAGVHPEGTRKKDDDPYTLLPAQRGVGRIIHASRVPVIPVFINGLVNDLRRQVLGNFDGSGERIIVVFGAPVDYGSLLDAPASPKTDRAIAERTLQVIAELGQEERQIRAARALAAG